MRSIYSFHETARATRGMLGSKGSGCYLVIFRGKQLGYVKRMQSIWISADKDMHALQDATGLPIPYPTRTAAAGALLANRVHKEKS